jgi:sporulation protein YlmC with PRC-barrel domain
MSAAVNRKETDENKYGDAEDLISNVSMKEGQLMRWKTLSSFAVLALVATFSFTSLAWADHTQPEIVKGSKIIGKSVQTMGGKNIGEIEDLAIDELDGQVRYVVLSFGGILGLGEKYFAIPWEALSLSDNKEHFALAVTEKELEKAPGFDKKNWPDFADPVYYATIYDFYQVPLPKVGEKPVSKTDSSKTSEGSKTKQSKKEYKK